MSLLPALCASAGCTGSVNQSVLEPNGPGAEAVTAFWWFALALAAAVYAATIGALLWAGWRARQREQRGELRAADEERRMTRGVTAGVAATVVILLVYFGVDLAVGRTLRIPHERPHLLVRVTGYQWWWKVEYPDSVPQGWITDANEIHVPVGKPVLVELASNDVIHSLWIPNLGGKKDLIPKYRDTLWFQAERPGVYRSQCAEFCGHQHAKMALEVVVHESDDFERWRQQSRRWAPSPVDTLARRGQEVFMAGRCVLCHAIAGTPAGSRVGPDLTHIASRRTLAAGTLANTRGNLAAWITDPQQVKPGANMPPNALAPADLDALLAYLQSLK
jgi:cytochrome c oxidase subunit II